MEGHRVRVVVLYVHVWVVGVLGSVRDDSDGKKVYIRHHGVGVLAKRPGDE